MKEKWQKLGYSVKPLRAALNNRVVGYQVKNDIHELMIFEECCDFKTSLGTSQLATRQIVECKYLVKVIFGNTYPAELIDLILATQESL